MDDLADYRLPFGLPYIVIPLVFSPIHLRILYVLLRHKEYRKMECYRIMTQIEIFDTLIVPFYIFQGFSILFESPICGFTVFFGVITSALLTCIVCMDVVLALNRLQVFCNIRYPRLIDKALQVIVWLGGATFCGVCYSSLAGFLLSADGFTLQGDFSKPWTASIGFYLAYIPLGSFLTTFTTYIVIFLYLLYKKARTENIQTNSAEWRILAQAVVRFLGDGSIEATLFYQITFTVDNTSPMFSQIFHFASLINFVCIPPIVFLVLNRSVRSHVIGITMFEKKASIQVALVKEMKASLN
ncbi:hypothetical protein QR680_010002 [Steinernema hermaphroditum]|uniref:Uncharacterized protein n=1 Tax=Steinernema hermaphroditum TaxID=289476 RepID=A0AA39IPX7_9BILA|nr:hypothetical protein QR680_010002 [Steinernema hermaphroditum]